MRAKTLYTGDANITDEGIQAGRFHPPPSPPETRTSVRLLPIRSGPVCLAFHALTFNSTNVIVSP